MFSFCSARQGVSCVKHVDLFRSYPNNVPQVVASGAVCVNFCFGPNITRTTQVIFINSDHNLTISISAHAKAKAHAHAFFNIGRCEDKT